MISTKQKVIDDKNILMQDNASDTKSFKIPEWLKNTSWSVGAPYKTNSAVYFNEDNIIANISDENSTTGLSMLALDSSNSVNIIEEQDNGCYYTVCYSTDTIKNLSLTLSLNKDKNSAKFIFKPLFLTDIAFFVTKDISVRD